MRPRSERAHNDVLNAASRLFAERGIDGTSMDAIAEESRVSKATIYKHWPDKDALCLEVLSRAYGLRDAVPEPSGDLRDDLLAVVRHEPPARDAELRARMMPHLMAYAARNPAFGRAWQARVFDPPRDALIRRLRRAVASGELPKGTDVGVAIALLLGPMMYGHILKRINKPAPPALAESVVDAFLRAAATAPRRHPRPAAGRSTAARRRMPV